MATADCTRPMDMLSANAQTLLDLALSLRGVEDANPRDLEFIARRIDRDPRDLPAGELARLIDQAGQDFNRMYQEARA